MVVGLPNFPQQVFYGICLMCDLNRAGKLLRGSDEVFELRPVDKQVNAGITSRCLRSRKAFFNVPVRRICRRR